LFHCFGKQFPQNQLFFSAFVLKEWTFLRLDKKTIKIKINTDQYLGNEVDWMKGKGRKEGRKEATLANFEVDQIKSKGGFTCQILVARFCTLMRIT